MSEVKAVCPTAEPKDLVVRVVGYSAFFVDLEKTVRPNSSEG
jgi:pyruvate-formate lyase